ncbi:hypothetical protein SAMN05192574_102163 [Mucilaginibacter gossypiicola]|uniref:Uncharacterized protein n=1 Tax=Mucilaginibacter gossypiicola TaxID=551995 RepID=A0A1H8D183_9SPHI|nr:hypothetical protein [Mucilaginibacter gossypiicola]SEN00942.1 hypothetical protein SAMN05192574_102163 [Mucilaginibacter gossypiicola]
MKKLITGIAAVFMLIQSTYAQKASSTALNSGSAYLTPEFKIGEKYGTIFSRTIALTSDKFQPVVVRISGTGIYQVSSVDEKKTTFDAEFLYDGRPVDHSKSGITDGGRTLIYNDKPYLNTDGSGLAYNPFLWGDPPAHLKKGDSWELNIAQPWELGGPGKETVTVMSIDPVNATVKLRREGNGTGAFAGDHAETEILLDGKRIRVNINPGDNHWVGYAIIRRGIIISDELLVTRPVTLTAENVNLNASQRQYILLNQMAD